MSLGFRDIHFLHGQFEFGKDFIAKRDENGTLHQFTFQTKAGNLNLSGWNDVRGQIDMLRTNAIAHPNFDRTLPRKPVLVTTGRLAGAAPAAAQDYGTHLQQLGEGSFEIWDRERLVELIGHSRADGTDALSGQDRILLLRTMQFVGWLNTRFMSSAHE